jgi:hypothetical protein
MAIQLIMAALSFLRRGSVKRNSGEKPTGGRNMTAGDYVRLCLRFFQFILVLVVIGLYAQDVNKAVKAGAGRDTRWMYASIMPAFAAVWAIIVTVAPIKWWFFFGVDYTFFLLYLVAFGIFGKIYIKADAEGNKGVVRMKNAVWVLVANMILWFITASWGAYVFWQTRKAKTSPSAGAYVV